MSADHDPPGSHAPTEVPGRSRRRRRTIIVLAGTVVLVLVAALVVALAVRSGSGSGSGRTAGTAATTPTSAAQGWIDAHLRHDAAAVQRRSCPGGTQLAATFDLVQADVRSAHAGPAVASGPDRWTVTLAVQGATGPAGSFPVHVERSGGRYLVC